MKRINDDEISLSQDEINDIYEFIRDTLYREWDHYTDHFICSDPLEEGMKRMNPTMYKFADKLMSI